MQLPSLFESISITGLRRNLEFNSMNGLQPPFNHEERILGFLEKLYAAINPKDLALGSMYRQSLIHFRMEQPTVEEGNKLFRSITVFLDRSKTVSLVEAVRQAIQISKIMNYTPVGVRLDSADITVNELTSARQAAEAMHRQFVKSAEHAPCPALIIPVLAPVRNMSASATSADNVVSIVHSPAKPPEPS